MLDDNDKIPDQPWLGLLTPIQQAWRENEFMKGRNPDAYIEQQLREAGVWPPNPQVGHA